MTTWSLLIACWCLIAMGAALLFARALRTAEHREWLRGHPRSNDQVAAEQRPTVGV